MKRLLIILGPTAAGKTDYSIEEALKYGSPVISCDSRQIYREMSIGTAVPSAEQLAAVRHYFIHSHSIHSPYTAGKYEVEALALIRRLFAEGRETLVMAGGSGFYIDALCKGLDDFPEADQELRAALSQRLKEEGVESLRLELKRLDPESYATIDIANGQRVVRALEVCLMTGRPFSSFKTSPQKKREFRIEKIGIAITDSYSKLIAIVFISEYISLRCLRDIGLSCSSLCRDWLCRRRKHSLSSFRNHSAGSRCRRFRPVLTII